jgi:hypothetical protein
VNTVKVRSCLGAQQPVTTQICKPTELEHSGGVIPIAKLLARSVTPMAAAQKGAGRKVLVLI